VSLRKYLSKRFDVGLVKFVDEIWIAFQQIIKRL